MYRCAQTPVAEHRDRAADIVTSYDRVCGCTLRQAYYRLVAERLIPHTAPTYRRLSSRLAQARREERFPDLIDPLREVHVSPAWPDAGAFLRAAPTGSPWTGQPARRQPCTWPARRTLCGLS